MFFIFAGGCQMRAFRVPQVLLVVGPEDLASVGDKCWDIEEDRGRRVRGGRVGWGCDNGAGDDIYLELGCESVVFGEERLDVRGGGVFGEGGVVRDPTREVVFGEDGEGGALRGGLGYVVWCGGEVGGWVEGLLGGISSACIGWWRLGWVE
jgi:hypothetical protein